MNDEKSNSNLTSFFTTNRHFDSPSNCSISTCQFLKASQGTVDFISLFGKIFNPIKSDISGNIEKLNTIYSSCPELFSTLNDIVESESGKASSELIGTNALLWLTRAFDYIFHFLTLFLQDYELGKKSKNLTLFFKIAYESTLKKHHNWFVQKIFKICLLAVVDRENFLILLSNCSLLNIKCLTSDVEAAIFLDIKKYTKTLKENLETLRSQNSGKTLLLKSIQEPKGKVKCIKTVPTVGTNVVYLTNIISKKPDIVIQEVGGEMESIWDQYFNDCKALIYVINSDNLAKIGKNTLNLIKILNNALIKNKKPVHIVFSKVDQLSCISLKESIVHAFFLDDIIKSFPSNSIKITGCSSLTGEGIDSLLKWIYEVNSKF